jgi:hypothetical protein
MLVETWLLIALGKNKTNNNALTKVVYSPEKLSIRIQFFFIFNKTLEVKGYITSYL